jgi:hypothetical protein
MGLIRTLIIFLAIYFLFKLVVRVILPLLVKNYVDKKAREFQNRYNQNHQQFNKKPEGEITIETKKDTKGKGKGNDEGEYVDYEEIKD